jgi:hypothetical protein
MDFAEQVPNVDLISFVFGNSDYDEDKPVRKVTKDASHSLIALDLR